MGALGILLTTSIAPFVAAQLEKLIHDQVAAGTPLDVAVRGVLADLETHIANPVLRAAVEQILNALLSVVEGAVKAAAPTPAA